MRRPLRQAREKSGERLDMLVEMAFAAGYEATSGWARKHANGQHGYARVRVVVRVTNTSDHNVIVRECSGRAENARGQQLFDVEPLSGDYWRRVLAPETGFGGPMGYSPRITPVVRGAATIRGVDHVETSCLAYQWEGAVPPPPED